MKCSNACWKAILVICIFISSQSFAQEKKDTVRVLLVGNSYIYYNNLAQMIGLITDSLDTKIICKKSDRSQPSSPSRKEREGGS